MVARTRRQPPAAPPPVLEELKAGMLERFRSPETSARDVAALAREIRIVDEKLAAAAAPSKGDPLDELAKRRARRRRQAPG